MAGMSKVHIFSSSHTVLSSKFSHWDFLGAFLFVCFYLENFCASLDLFLLAPSTTQACLPKLISSWKILVQFVRPFPLKVLGFL